MTTTTTNPRDTIHWEVWRSYPKGPLTVRVEPVEYRDPEKARESARQYDEEEREMAAMEQRTIRFKYMVVEALTKREVLR